MRLRLSPELEIDLDSHAVRADGFRVWVGGESGSGKSTACSSIAGQVLRHGSQVVVLDAHGEHGGLWELAPKRIVRIGYGDELPDVDPDDAETVAAAVAPVMKVIRSGASVLINFLPWIVLHPRKVDAFVLELAKQLYLLRQSKPGFTLLVVEEASLFIPQAQGKGQAENVRIFINITTGGRKFGLHVVFSTQRQSLVDVSALASCNIRLFLRISDKRDWVKIRDSIPDKLGVTFATDKPSDINTFDNGEAVVLTRWTKPARVKLLVPSVMPKAVRVG